MHCWKYPTSVIELPTRGLSWCVYTPDCPQPVNWSVWTSWAKNKMRWAGLGEDHWKWEGPPLLLYKQVFSASGGILKTLVVIIVQSLSCVQLFVTPWTAARLSFTVSQSLLRLMFIESLVPSNYLILCHPLLLLPSVFPSIRVFSSKSALRIIWPKYWSFTFSISPSTEYSGLISFKIDWFDLSAVQGTLKSLLQQKTLVVSLYFVSMDTTSVLL